MSAANKLLGGSALVMALCCAIGPLAAAALIAGAGPLGIIVGVLVLLALGAWVTQRRRAGRRC